MRHAGELFINLVGFQKRNGIRINVTFLPNNLGSSSLKDIEILPFSQTINVADPIANKYVP